MAIVPEGFTRRAGNVTFCLFVGTRVQFVVFTTSHDRLVYFAHDCFHAPILSPLSVNDVAKMKRTPVFQKVENISSYHRYRSTKLRQCQTLSRPVDLVGIYVR